ncbi:MAG: hypothetical protein ACLQFR_16650 [Streptosporangiaceae bacterium]
MLSETKPSVCCGADWRLRLQAHDPKTVGLVDDAIYALSCSSARRGRALGNVS